MEPTKIYGICGLCRELNLYTEITVKSQEIVNVAETSIIGVSN